MSTWNLYVFGSNGQVGSALRRRVEAQHPDVTIVPLTRADLDFEELKPEYHPYMVKTEDIVEGEGIIAHGGVPDRDGPSNAELITELLRSTGEIPPGSVILNLAAYTHVDLAEGDGRRRAWRVNSVAAGAIADAGSALGLPVVYVSTDYVFDGTASEPYATDAAPKPLNIYGLTKLSGERETLRAGGHVVRSSWVFSGSARDGSDFVTTMEALAAERAGQDPTAPTAPRLSVVCDQWGRPTFADHLAEGLLDLCTQLHNGAEMPAILHCAGSGEPTTWWHLARDVFLARGLSEEWVEPVKTAHYATAASRPLRAVLSLQEWSQAGLRELPAWEQGLSEALG